MGGPAPRCDLLLIAGPVTEINYLNKALELFNTALVTPTYYVIFTFSTLVTSVVLFQGLNAPVDDIITLVLGCASCSLRALNTC